MSHSSSSCSLSRRRLLLNAPLIGLASQIPQALAAERASAEVSSRLWAEFCDSLKRVGERILSPEAPDTPLDRAEGFRYLTRLLRVALEQEIEYSDPLFPGFYSLSGPTVKIGADNPDNLYYNAQVRGDRRYRITGRRGTVNYLAFSTKGGGYGRDGSLRPTGFLDSTQLEVGPDGRFEVIVSAERQPGNWLPMTPETTLLIVRQTFLDRASEQPAELSITCLDAPRGPEPLTPEALARQLESAVKFVDATVRVFADWAQTFKAQPNRFTRQDQSIYARAGGDPSIFYAHGYWELEPDEALVVELPPTEAEFWNFQLNNYWMESLDYRYFNIHVNKRTAHYNPDGSVTVVIAHRDPGVPNWLDTTGHRAGTMLFRVVRGKDPEYPTARLVRLQDLRR